MAIPVMPLLLAAGVGGAGVFFAQNSETAKTLKMLALAGAGWWIYRKVLK